MRTDFINTIHKIVELSDELFLYRNSKQNLIYRKSKIDNDLKQGIIDEKYYNNAISSLLKNHSYEELINYYNTSINKLLREIKLLISETTSELAPFKGREAEQKKVMQETKTTKRPKTEYTDFSELEKKFLRKFIDSKKKSKSIKEFLEEEYSIYKSNFYAKISNQVMGNLTLYLTNKYSQFFIGLYKNIKMANIRLLSKTYISIMLFSSILAFPILTLLSLIFVNIFMALFIGIVGIFATLFVIYFYPKSILNDRKKKIKYDLVFAIVHMAAISESGAQPISMFRLLLESREYKYLDPEIKRILNYVNLFGYNLSTALKTVAATTPSYELKELLNGIIAAIETGGDLKKYMQDKADDALSQYKLDQEKYTSRLETYSDLYTGILIAGPLLFLITLTILDKVSPTLGTLKISTIAAAGTYFFIPLINIGFIIFLNLTKTEI